jgi:hypothetical protein
LVEVFADVKDIKSELKHLRERWEISKDELNDLHNVAIEKIDILKEDMRKDKIRSQQYVIGVVVGFVVTIILALLFGRFGL